MVGDGQGHAQAALPRKKKMTRCTLYRWLGGPQRPSGGVRRMSPPTGIRSPDRLTRSESLYRLNYLGSHSSNTSVRKLITRVYSFCCAKI